MTQRLSAARLERMHTVLSGYIDRGEMPGIVALVSRGETVHVEALGALSFGGSPMKRDAIFRIASMTKPITAAAAMILVEECRLRLDDPVDEFLPELANRKVLRRSTPRSTTSCLRNARSRCAMFSPSAWGSAQ
jgi:CubicO group peptidase (beta-lactamase class C family)